MHEHYRHGDLLIERVDSMPAEVKRIKGNILAHGEVTGHTHRIVAPSAVRLFEPPQKEVGQPSLYFELAEDTAVTHEEHGTKPLPAGTYAVTIQREWSDADEPVQVLD